MGNDGQRPQQLTEEPLCPLWQKKCGEVNPGKVVCKRLIQVMGIRPGDLAPHPMLMCYDDYILGRLEKLMQMITPQSQLPRGMNINDMLRKG